MDSLTQIVLGAAVGEAVLGKKVGNKAMLYGAIAGTIPDLDVYVGKLFDTVTALEIHRGFTHSVFFAIVFGWIFGWLISLYEKNASTKEWALLMFWGFITHPILDAHTTWGTQLFWPLDLRLAFKNIFVIDPLYTLPFLVFLLMAMFQRKGTAKRTKYNNLGLIISSSYMAITLVIKGITYSKFSHALKEQGISYKEIETKPTPFNTILWSANVETDDAYLIGYYSFFDTKPIEFYSYPKNHHLLDDYKNNVSIKRLIKITKGWYTISEKNNLIYLNDLRFGLLSVAPNFQQFAFSFQITKKQNKIVINEVPRNREKAKQLLTDLWVRIQGN
ncbi:MULTISPECIES: metal-dependent hydrolase [Tenacibaculum]|uniref:Metal-dependent hydrolase n=1 Tax=Tenacibaculum mesophilum TaxID=104268 RepID=A0AAE9SH42_9FLAO|nr:MULTISPECIES: metal-dependent hydrolase [Tenacibaculum]GFD83532.1 membrane protein [Tenacibaculum sp. KUL118]GFD93145.1 membrane protein [Alteromonas sp. KUL154]GFE01629.1 membrane protein [Alteromonas sp. KUL156]MCG7502964.1 metal-dependent hydrolase [Tenacibaculum sp. Mcav3-52]UTD14176.1 metal-dependent hydrolase [Tenacibaculum mesophilum]